MQTKSSRHMRAEERETLGLRLACGYSLRTVATVLGRAPSTVSREHARNAKRAFYRACTAHALASARARQPRRLRKLLDPWLWQYVRTHLAEGYSPEQIAGRLQRVYPDDMGKQLSAEIIYAGLYVLPRGTLRSELLAALRQVRGTDRRGQIPNMTPITERPAEGGHPHRARPLGRRPHQGRPQWLGRGHPGRADHTQKNDD